MLITRFQANLGQDQRKTNTLRNQFWSDRHGQNFQKPHRGDRIITRIIILYKTLVNLQKYNNIKYLYKIDNY